MNPKIKILIAEHNQEDLALLEQVLKKGGIDYVSTIVNNEADFRNALNNFIPDIIISEFIFPAFDGPTAYQLKMELAVETPFIFVCTEIGEENCVGYIDNGVTDYILKDRMFSLPAKIKRALKETSIRKQKEKIENELLKSEARLNEAQALSKIGSWETNLSTWEVIWSAETYNIFDIEPGKFATSHQEFLAFVHPDDLTNVNAAFTASFTNSSINKLEHRIITTNGYEKIVEEHWQIICNEQGLPSRAVGTCQDITARKKAEQQHEFEKRNNEALINSTDDLIWSVDTEIKLVAANNAFIQNMEAATGTKLKSGDNLMISHTFLPVFLSSWEKYYRRALSGESVKEEIYSPKVNNRPAYWRDVTFNPVIKNEKVIGIACYSRNITETRKAEEKIKESVLRYRSLIEHASDAICIVDTNMKFIEINNIGCEQSGYTREEILQLSVADILFAEDLKTVPLLIPTLTPGTTFLQERRLKKKDGTALVMELSGKMLEDGRVLIFIRDVSERNKAAQLISESEAKYRAFFDNSMDGMLLTIPDGAILAANPAACEIFQMTEAEICTAGRKGLVDLSDPRVMALLKERQNKGRARGELTLIRKDGSRLPAEISTVLFKNSFGKEGTSMFIRDISERKASEYSLMQTTKELKHTLGNLYRIMNSSLDIICTIDEDGKFVDVSAASAIIWGYTALELIGKKYIDFVFEDDIENTLKAADQIMNGAPESIFENRYVNKDKSIVPMLWSAKWDNKHKITYCIAKDASEKKRLEKAFEIERKRFQDLYSQAPSCMGILKGPDHVFEIANPLYLQLIGKKDIIGKPVKEVLPELLQQGIFEILNNVYKTGQTFSANEKRVQFDLHGTGKLVDTYLNFIYQAHINVEGAIDGILFFAIDVTEQVLSRKKIEASEKRYRQIVETAQEGIWVIDENNKTNFVNHKMCKILEYAPKDMLGKEIYFFMAEEESRLAENFIDGKNEGQINNFQIKFTSKTGKDVWTNLSANPLFEEGGYYKGRLFMITDITESKNAEAKLIKRESQLSLATNLAKLGYWEYDIVNDLFTFNDQFYDIFKTSAKKMSGYTMSARRYTDLFVHPDDHEIVARSVEEAIISNNPTFTYKNEHRILYANGESGYVSVHFFIVKDSHGCTIKTFGVNQDITERKLSENLLNEMNSHLKNQAKELALSNTELEQFAYVASHDLQEPLRMVTSFLSLLATRYENIIDVKGKQYINFAVDGAERMRLIILNLLEFSRVGRTQDNLEYIDLNVMTKDIKLLFQKLIEDKKAIITIDPLPTIHSYSAPLRQVFQNLIGNALKYSRQDVPPKIHISVKEFKNEWQFAVADNGIGISDEYFDKIFIIFQRLHNKNEFSGTGIGLAITKKIIELQGGKIWLTSTEGKGSTFYFTINK